MVNLHPRGPKLRIFIPRKLPTKRVTGALAITPMMTKQRLHVHTFSWSSSMGEIHRKETQIERQSNGA